VVEDGPVRRITEAWFSFASSRLLLRTVAYASWPVLELQFRVVWNEVHRRLKLEIPTVFGHAQPQCEIPGGCIRRPDDGDQHVHGRWFMLEGPIAGQPAALGVVNSGQHGLDCVDGTVTLSVLRAAAYCHERGQSLRETPATKLMDQGVHDFRLLVTAGAPEMVRGRLPGLADWLDAPPVAYPHLPTGPFDPPADTAACTAPAALLTLTPASVRMTACKPSADAAALIVRCHETQGSPTSARLVLHWPHREITLELQPFEIATVRIERDGSHRMVDLIDET
jgi:alpha-mannosidase